MFQHTRAKAPSSRANVPMCFSSEIIVGDSLLLVVVVVAAAVVVVVVEVVKINITIY